MLPVSKTVLTKGFMKMSNYQICTRCIMDSSDPEITFDENGVCSHCHQYDKNVLQMGYKPGKSQEELKQIIAEMKAAGKGKEYDCILGISGGVDSSYLAYLTAQMGLRVLAVHVDAGWNCDVAVSNIQKMCEKLKIDLHTIVVDWPTMKELQRAYMFSGLPNLDVPQDHVFIAGMYQYAKKYNIKYMLNGGNLATEGILPGNWGHNAMDWWHIKSVYQKCGRNKISLKKYPHAGLLSYAWERTRIRQVRLLNYIPYSKKEAIATLEREFGWEYYGGKHFESRFTKFFQSYYLPVKFGYDKRRAHLSSLVVSGEITRDEALMEMQNEFAYPMDQIMEDRDYILKKLDITQEEWEQIMSAPVVPDNTYRSQEPLLRQLRKLVPVHYGIKG